MRSLPIDHCPRCQVRANGNTYCARCGVDMVDANGHPRVEPSLDPIASAVRPRDVAALYGVLFAFDAVYRLCHPAYHSFAGLVSIPIRVAIWTVELALVWCLVAWIRHLRIVRPWRRPTAIESARPGDEVRVRGTIRTLVPPDDASARRTTAVLVRRAIRGRTRLYYAKHSYLLFFTPFEEALFLRHRLVDDVSVGGRFAVRDATGVAIVDDDAIRVLDARPLHAYLRDPLVALEDGDEVDVFGPAVRGTALDACVLGGLPLDRSANALVYDGRSDAKVTIVLRKKARTSVASARPVAAGVRTAPALSR